MNIQYDTIRSQRNSKRLGSRVLVAACIAALLATLAFATSCSNANAPASSPSFEEQASQAYAQKIHELMDQYGEPAIVKGEYWSYATGLVFAKLLDFGAGYDYLMLAYYDPSKDRVPDRPASEPESYCVEVWGYVDGALSQQYAGTGEIEGQNVYCVGIPYLTEGDVSFVKHLVLNGYPIGTQTIQLWGVDEEGGFSVVQYAQGTYDPSPSELEVNGKTVSQSEFDAIVQKWRDNTAEYFPTALDTTDRDVEQATATVEETLSQLEG